jgi:uroporphyrinogen-III decarboxylase
MTHRDRALAAMRGEPVDRMPFIARMDLWYGFHHNRGTLPHPYEHAGLWDIQRDLGVGIFGFGVWDVSFYKLTHYLEVVKSSDGGTTTTEYRTPYGTLTCRDRMAEELAEAAGAGARIEFPFKSSADYDALMYLIEHTMVQENFEEYGRFVDSIGGDGLALPFSGHLPAHQLMLQFMGYERFYYELFENEDRVEELVDTLTDKQHDILALAVKCPVQAIEVGGNYDEQMTPPPIFDRFFAPFYYKARKLLSLAGKVLVVHGDGEMKVLLTSLVDCGVQVVEALTPSPMTSIDVRRTREIWKDKVAMWGGLPSVILTEVFSDAEFERYMEDLFDAVASGDRFILGFGDNVPTDALFHRVKRVAELWSQQ